MTQESAATRCPACGTAASGTNFCHACGAALGTRSCPACGAGVAAGARFCGQCGADTAAERRTPAIASRRSLWAVGIAGAALMALVLVLLVRKGTASTPAVTGPAADGAGEVASGGSPPDISRMSPRERFDRLYNRIMRAAESGDEATVTRFTPMALMAYQQLPDVDADARYHAALLKVHTGDVSGALALGDTILAASPGHLFGYIVRGTVARWQKDSAALTAAYRGFLEHYDAEMKAGRAEYGEHTRAIDEFRAAAQNRKGGKATT
jgi:double zinc ribbon protein